MPAPMIPHPRVVCGLRYDVSMRVLHCAAVLALVSLAATAGRVIAQGQSPLLTRVHASGFDSPVAFVQDPTDQAVQFVVEQRGRIRAVRSGALLPVDFLDLRGVVLSGGERGLLGMALSPDYAATGRFYVNFTNGAGHTVIARFKRSGNPVVADLGTRFDLRWAEGPFVRQPYANHNGGHLAFGPDGYLYIGLGDGGSANDPEHRAQTPSTLLGKMLRIDVGVADAHPAGYVVPPTNPFVSAGPPGTLPEIWSFGLRNPWRYTFDDPSRGGTGALIMGDVGQGQREEIDYEPAGRGGRNYGWRNMEGSLSYIALPPPAFLPLRNPVHEYDRSSGQSVTGGYVYRGTALGAAYRGRYFFADFVQSRVWSVALAIDPVTGEAIASGLIDHTAQLGGAAQLSNVSSFGVDADGELYIVSYGRGVVLKVLGAPSPPTGLRIIR